MKNKLMPIVVILVVILGAGLVWLRSRGGESGRLESPDGSASAEAADGGAAWVRPPPIGTDPDYQGPPPTMPMKYSPYALEAAPTVKRRRLPRDNEDPGMAAAIAEVAAGDGRDIGYVGGRRGRRFRHIAKRVRSVEAGLLEGEDPAAAAQRLGEAGFRYLLVSNRHPRPMPWMQSDMVGITIRLRDALPMSHFHPLIFSRSHILYRIAPPMTFDQSERARITAWVRDSLTGRPAAPLGIERATDSVGRDEHRVIVALRNHGEQRLLARRLMEVSASGETLEAALRSALRELGQGWDAARTRARRQRDVELPESLAAAMGSLELDIEVVDRMCRIIDRRNSRLAWQYEIGLEGIYLETSDDFHFMSPAMPVWRSDQYRRRTAEGRSRRARHYAGERTSVEDLMAASGLARDAWRQSGEPGTARGPYEHDFGRFDTHHWIEREAGGEVVSLYRGLPLIHLSEITRERLVQALQLGAGWLAGNQLPDGQFRYKYEPLNENPERRWTEGNNIVRHALNPYTLLLVNRVAPDERLVESARRGIAFTLEHLRREGDRCAIWHQDVPARYDNAKMGTVAVTILSILAMGDVLDISEYEDELRCLAEELIYVQDPNGHFRQYDVPEDHAYYGCTNSIFPGEMLLALARMYSHTRDERYRQAFDRSFDYYRQWWAINVQDHTQDGVYTEEERVNLVGFVPWNVMALEEMHSTAPEQRYADFAFQIQDWMDETFFYDPARTPYPDYLGSYYKHHWETPAINSSGYTEGAAAAYALALRTGRDVESRRETLVLGVRFALQLQYESYDTSFFLPDPGPAMGGFRFHLARTRVRNDYLYHAMSTLSQALEHLRPEDYPAQTPITLPPSLREAL